MTVLTLNVRLEERDVVRAHLRTLTRLPGIRFVGLLLLLPFLTLALAVLRALSRGESPTTGGWLVVALFGVVALLPIQAIRTARNRYRSLAPEQATGTYLFDANGFEWSLGKDPGKAAWDSVRRAEETDDHVFLHMREPNAHVIPKRGLSEEELEKLREVLVDFLSGSGSEKG